MSIQIFGKNSPLQLSSHFYAHNFDCPCHSCHETIIASALPEMLEKMREKLGQALLIHSGYRCQAYQEELRNRGYETAKGISQHTLGAAADIASPEIPGLKLEFYARAVGFLAVGVASTWVHVDLRPCYHSWTYNKR